MTHSEIIKALLMIHDNLGLLYPKSDSSDIFAHLRIERTKIFLLSKEVEKLASLRGNIKTDLAIELARSRNFEYLTNVAKEMFVAYLTADHGMIDMDGVLRTVFSNASRFCDFAKAYQERRELDEIDPMGMNR